MVVLNKKNPRLFSLTGVEKYTQALSEIEKPRTSASVSIRAEAKKFKALRCSATIQKSRVIFARGAQNK